MSALPMNTIEDALHAWVAAGSGLGTSKVIWYGQNGKALTGSYVVLRVLAIRPVGNDWVDTVDNPSPSAGAEVLNKVRGMRRVRLQLTCFAGTPIGASGAASILNDVLTSIALPSRSDALAAAGVGISNLGDVTAIDGVINSNLLEPRALAEVVFFAAAELVETGTYIQHVQVTDQVPEPDEVFTVN